MSTVPARLPREFDAERFTLEDLRAAAEYNRALIGTRAHGSEYAPIPWRDPAFRARRINLHAQHLHAMCDAILDVLVRDDELTAAACMDAEWKVRELLRVVDRDVLAAPFDEVDSPWP